MLNQRNKPDNADDLFRVERFDSQPSQAVPFEIGSGAAGEAFRIGHVFSNPGYSESLYDQPKTEAVGAAPYIPYEKELELNDHTDKYYQSVNQLNTLAVKARALGFNIKQPDFRDREQVAYSNEYNTQLARTQALAEELKQKRENFKAIAPSILSGQVKARPYEQGYDAQDLATTRQTTDAPVTQYNRSDTDATEPGQYAQVQDYQQRTADIYQSVLTDPKATEYDKQWANEQLQQMQPPTFNNNAALDRAQRERLARERQKTDKEPFTISRTEQPVSFNLTVPQIGVNSQVDGKGNPLTDAEGQPVLKENIKPVTAAYHWRHQPVNVQVSGGEQLRDMRTGQAIKTPGVFDAKFEQFAVLPIANQGVKSSSGKPLAGRILTDTQLRNAKSGHYTYQVVALGNIPATRGNAERSFYLPIDNIEKRLTERPGNNAKANQQAIAEAKQLASQLNQQKQATPSTSKPASAYPLPTGQPRSVRQNGFTYSWNESTGQYE